MFQCDKCGACCRNLDKSPLYAGLHDGDGVCRYLRDNLCSIYEDRPLLCRIDESYERLLKGTISKQDYYRLNYEACSILKKQL